jgi:thiol-disulfide isomerase/thioredoxin
MRLPAIALLLLMPACDRAAQTPKESAGAVQAAARALAAPQLSPEAAAKVDRTAAGTPAPNIPFETRAGKVQTIADFRGRPVLVNLWATWCAPCKKEMPALDRLATRLAGRTAVLAISQDLEGWRAIDKFFTAGTFATVAPHADSAMAYGAAIKAQGLPVTILYDVQGREVWRINGDFAWDGADAALLLGA